MWQFLLGLVVGLALGWWLDWYLSRQEAISMREEMDQKSTTIAKLQKELLALQQKAKAPKPRKPTRPPPAEKAEEAVQAYCVKCKEHRPMNNPRRVTLSNGRPALRDTCPVCGSGLFRMVKA